MIEYDMNYVSYLEADYIWGEVPSSKELGEILKESFIREDK